MKPLRIAHLSDPHFSTIMKHPRQLLSKEWLGNLNYTLFRQKSYVTDHLSHLPRFLHTLDLDAIFISGDFTTTAKHEEYKMAKEFAESFDVPTFCVPGNHDVYTHQATREKRYYSYLPHSEDLKNTRVTAERISEGWWWVGLDCAVPTSFFSSHGTFFRDTEERLKQVLSSIPADDKVIVVCHFPLFKGDSRHGLWRSSKLKEILKNTPQVKIYLHGHDHAPYILHEKGFPLVVNSGSCAHRPNGTFFLIKLDSEGCVIERCLLKHELQAFTWVKGEEKRYEF